MRGALIAASNACRTSRPVRQRTGVGRKRNDGFRNGKCGKLPFTGHGFSGSFPSRFARSDPAGMCQSSTSELRSSGALATSHSNALARTASDAVHERVPPRARVGLTYNLARDFHALFRSLSRWGAQEGPPVQFRTSASLSRLKSADVCNRSHLPGRSSRAAER